LVNFLILYVLCVMQESMLRPLNLSIARAFVIWHVQNSFLSPAELSLKRVLHGTSYVFMLWLAR